MIRCRVRGKRLWGLVVATAVALVAVPASASAQDEGFRASGSVEQVQVYGAKPGQTVKLIRKGKVVGTDTAGSLGASLFRKVKPGKGYTVKQGSSKAGPVKVMTDSNDPASTKTYDQSIPVSGSGGYGYMKMRDGTKLAYNVSLPGQAGTGPYPTLIEYSGYGTADPDGPESGIAIIGNLLGYAVIDVNMRGSGCSGGAFDFFEKLQSLDGYDIVETVARQPWVKGDPGMLGISYGGISQLFTAQTQPPHLAAITPLSVIDNTQTTLYPGGILNTGFAFEWAVDRVHDARAGRPRRRPALGLGADPERRRDLQGRTRRCTPRPRPGEEDRPQLLLPPATADPLDPSKFVDQIRSRPSWLASGRTSRPAATARRWPRT